MPEKAQHNWPFPFRRLLFSYSSKPSVPSVAFLRALCVKFRMKTLGWRVDLRNSFEDQVRKRGNECRRIAQRRHHFKLFDAEFVRFFAGFDINFVQRLDMFGDERD